MLLRAIVRAIRARTLNSLSKWVINERANVAARACTTSAKSRSPSVRASIPKPVGEVHA
jgi:hypothetical protein